jgi:hypothetical protein
MGNGHCTRDLLSATKPKMPKMSPPCLHLEVRQLFHDFHQLCLLLTLGNFSRSKQAAAGRGTTQQVKAGSMAAAAGLQGMPGNKKGSMMAFSNL